MLGWEAIGGAKLSLDYSHPLSKALPAVLKVTIPANAKGKVGFQNVGKSGASSWIVLKLINGRLLGNRSYRADL